MQDAAQERRVKEVAPPSQRTVAIRLTMAETGCTEKQAADMIKWLDVYVRRARRTNYRSQYPTDGSMRTDEYRLFEQVIPHGATSREGSAHEAIERALLNPSMDEYTITHEGRDDAHSPRYCQIQVAISVL